MQNRRSTTAAVPERRRLMPAGRILLFGLAVLLALAAVFPGQQLQRRLETGDFSDALSLAYLQAWLRAQPEKTRLRLVLAERQTAEQHFAEARITLRPLLLAGEPGSEDYRKAQALFLEVLNGELWAEKPGSAEFSRRRAALLAAMQDLSHTGLPAAQLERFADTALALGAPEQAEVYWRQLLAGQPGEAAALWQRIASSQLGRGDYRGAAVSYFRAMAVAGSRREQAFHFRAGLAALQSGNLLDVAMQEAEARWLPFADDADTLEYLARLARAANRLDLAEHYVARLLRQPLGRPV